MSADSRVATFIATIYVGSRVGRTADATARVHDIREIEEVCRAYCDEVGLCVTVTPITFIYTKGHEPGAAVGLINYPRFPSTPEAITEHALRLGELLRDVMEQMRVSVVLPDSTVLLQDEHTIEEAERLCAESCSEDAPHTQGCIDRFASLAAQPRAAPTKTPEGA